MCILEPRIECMIVYIRNTTFSGISIMICCCFLLNSGGFSTSPFLTKMDNTHHIDFLFFSKTALGIILNHLEYVLYI